MVIFLGFALLASAIIANKVVLLYLPPIFFVGIRMLGAGILLLVYLLGQNTPHFLALFQARSAYSVEH